jgi:DNA-directed RNA polymerase specialized sigma24 family protein
MSRRDRQILWLIFFEGRGRGEVSRHFGYSEEYFRVVLHRAMRRLRSLLPRDILYEMPLLHSLQKKPRKRASILASF